MVYRYISSSGQKSTCNSEKDFPNNANWTRCYNPNGKMYYIQNGKWY